MPAECEVCDGRHGAPESTVTFNRDNFDDEVEVRMCPTCLAAILDAMVEQRNKAVEASNFEVAQFCRMLDIEFPESRPATP